MSSRATKKAGTRKPVARTDADTTLHELANQIGEFIEYWGFKRVHGRLWTHLFLSEHPLDAGELIRRLQISKALVSMTLRDLLSYDVVRQAGRSARGTELFEANPDTGQVILNVLKQREKKMLERVRTSYAALSARTDLTRSDQSSAASSQRLEQLGDLIQNAETILAGILAFKSFSDLDR